MLPRFTKALLLCLSLTCCACTAAINTQPFAEFAQSVREVRDGTDAVLEQSAQHSRERILAGVEQDLQSDDIEVLTAVLDGLVLEFKQGVPFGWSNAKLPYLAAARFRADVLEVNEQFVSYADLLVRLTGVAPLEESAVDSMAARLNSETKRLLGHLEVPDASTTSGIIATGATAAFREFIRSRKKKHLKRAIEENQATVASYAALMTEACEIAAFDLRQSYLAKKDELRDAVMDAIETPSLRSRVEELLEYNVRFTTQMQSLRDINDNYKLIPAAHHDLIGTLESDAGTIQSVRYLLEQGRRLKMRYESLGEHPENPAVPAPRADDDSDDGNGLNAGG